MERIGVVGAGTMGSEIALESARQLAGAVVVIQDVNDEALGAGRTKMERAAARLIKKGQTTEALVAEAMERIIFTTSLDDLARSELVVEAVFENPEVKIPVFQKLEAIVSPETLLCSNTSGISISLLAGATRHPERVVGTHFFNPVTAMRLVEIARGYFSSDESVQRALDYCHALGKETIVCTDYPGFVTTRIGQGMMVEALRALQEGVASIEDIDKGVALAHNWPMGPLALIDLIGLDTELQVLENLHRELGEFFRPPSILKRMVNAGRFGRKSGAGFYDYSKK